MVAIPQWKQEDPKKNIHTLKLSHACISVMDCHIYNPGQWTVTCLPFWDFRSLTATNLAEAKTEAMLMLNTVACQIVGDLLAVSSAQLCRIDEQA